VSSISALSRGDEKLGGLLITVIKRPLTAKASELIVGHERDIPYGKQITFMELFERINSFETRSMNRELH
jgi:hypothetical protein